MEKTVLITGANRGIGLSLTQHYRAAGCAVFAVCRQRSAALASSGATVLDNVDVTDSEAIAQLVERLGDASIDLLINNAGILQNEVLGHIDYASIQQQFEVNTLGPLKITEALLPKLNDAAKIAMITSRMGSIADNGSGGRYGYRMSKAALNIASVSLAHDLRARGIAVAIIHPGLVGTEMIGGQGDVTPDEAAERIVARIDALTLSTSGQFWHANGEPLPW